MNKKVHTIYLSLGSNQGNRLAYLRQAVKHLRAILKDVRTSIVLETPAILPENATKEWDNPFLNLVVCGKTDLPPEALLGSLKSIEIKMGREKNHPTWGPRPIDLDILLYDQHCCSTETLTLPHPELLNRPFFLHLIALLNPLQSYPGSGENIGSLALQAAPKPSKLFMQSFSLYPQYVGVVNATPDSFSDGGLHFSTDLALEHARKLIQEGASIIDLGAQSTRPGAIQIGPEAEFEHLQPILEVWYTDSRLKDIPLSLDTYWPDLIIKCLGKYPISWINNVQGNLDDATLSVLAQSNCKLCTMHSLSIPPRSDCCLPLHESPMPHIRVWFERFLEHCCQLGFKNESIILDPGLGFGKNLYQNWLLLKQLDELKSLGCPILIGHSRKSFYTAVTDAEARDRDLETLAVSNYLQEKKIDYLRVHDVRLHQRFFTAQHCLKNCYED